MKRFTVNVESKEIIDYLNFKKRLDKKSYSEIIEDALKMKMNADIDSSNVFDKVRTKKTIDLTCGLRRCGFRDRNGDLVEHYKRPLDRVIDLIISVNAFKNLTELRKNIPKLNIKEYILKYLKEYSLELPHSRYIDINLILISSIYVSVVNIFYKDDESLPSFEEKYKVIDNINSNEKVKVLLNIKITGMVYRVDAFNDGVLNYDIYNVKYIRYHDLIKLNEENDISNKVFLLHCRYGGFFVKKHKSEPHNFKIKEDKKGNVEIKINDEGFNIRIEPEITFKIKK
ncbi:hypothetical protein [Proteus sp. STS61-E]|uniref:hypothetical protein n=1 Tax=Proteus sp. STS61-E TaxID=3237301 RepID=UPI0034C62C3C